MRSFISIALVVVSAVAFTASKESVASDAKFGCQQSNISLDQSEVQSRYTLFESGHVRPLALSPDGKRLYVVNTPNNCLEVYATDATLTPLAAIPVGLEPVAVAAPTNDEVWVVNHLSDSVSVIDLKGIPHVKATLLVGDEPRDIVFAGPKRKRAFISAAYRGQNHPTFDSTDLRESGHGRADVWVFDRTALGNGVGGTPINIVNLFSDVPRALAVSNDGATVYAAAFMSGNQTTVLEEAIVLSDLVNLEIGYFENATGSDLTLDQIDEILPFSPRDMFPFMTDEQVLDFILDIGLVRRVDGKLIVPYSNTNQFRINEQGQVVNQFNNEVAPVEIPEGVRLVALTDLPEPSLPRQKPAPHSNSEGATEATTGLIVKFDGSKWRDEAGTDWSDKVTFSLPDYDVFAIDAMAATPQEKSRISQVGTTLFNMAVNPVSGALYVSNIDARNEVRFEGPGLTASSVRGNIAQSRISVIKRGTVRARNLNKHLTHTEAQGASIPAAEKAKTLSQPMQMALSADGTTLYVAAMGSNKIGIFNTRALEQDSFTPDARSHIKLPGAGPTGVILNATGNRLYVASRLDNSVRAIDVAKRKVVATRAMFTPEPQSVVDGRRFLYDADLSSANGENACGSCHLFGDNDSLAWDLGDPDAGMLAKPTEDEPSALPAGLDDFHPMKGPMTTQTLRGIADHGPMHWRGDRTGNEPAVVNGVTESRESAAFKAFNPAFVTLLGRETPISDAQMQQFTDFALQIMPPPNPIRALDNTLNASQQEGHDLYMNAPLTLFVGNCNICHEVDREKRNFGTDGTLTFEGGRVSQDFKVPQLRNLYQKVGRFDQDGGEQVRGYGFLHDGSEPTMRRFLTGGAFVFESDAQRDLVSDFLFAMETNFAPVVGQQVTVTKENIESTRPRLQLLVARAQAHECDLVASGVLHGQLLQGVATDATSFSVSSGASIETDKLLKHALPITFTCYPPGNAQRLF